MKRFLMLIMIALLFLLVACSNDAKEIDYSEKQSEDTEAQAKTDNGNEQNTSEHDGGQMHDLQLKLQKQDKDAGMTIQNNEIYTVLDEAIKADPKMGVPNDFSLYPFDISINPDGSRSILFLAINRLKDSMKNIKFDMTFGNQEGEYIFENMELVLTEEEFGILHADTAIPFMLDVTPQQEQMFNRLTKDNVYIDMANFEMDIEK
ncbi:MULTISPECIES: hypothetical protein [Virgibacillus]|uniref:Lipoprotein n=1 Tax=Virgibacillus dokdonensis TaxID=302167 RepID=A0ABU7VHH3_9BACI|nr:hypothetical protein [Virgibacillus sp.]NWO13245.1 hypothetical protein [Virgibacillus sp.]